MTRSLVALILSSSLLWLAGCAVLASTTPVAKTSEPKGELEFYSVKLQVALAGIRQTQTLPTTWDHVQLTVESRRLKVPVSLDLATSTATVSADLMLPPGDATISAVLSNAGLYVGSGASTASLQVGTNTVLINLKTLLDFSGTVSAP